MFKQFASSAYGSQPTQNFYLSKGNGPSKVLVETMKGLTTIASGSIPGPGGHTYPKVLTFQWKNGSNSATLTLTDPKIVFAAAGAVNTNATMYGSPEYERLSGEGTLNVQWNGTNETASAPAIWEVSYTH